MCSNAPFFFLFLAAIFFFTHKDFCGCGQDENDMEELQLSRPQCKLPTFGNASEALRKARSACWKPSIERGAQCSRPVSVYGTEKGNLGNQLLSKRNIFIEPSLKYVALLEDSLWYTYVSPNRC